MSYSEENGQVILTMSREDHANLMVTFGLAMAAHDSGDSVMLGRITALLNRLNSGNPNYTPYQVESHDRQR